MVAIRHNLGDHVNLQFAFKRFLLMKVAGAHGQVLRYRPDWDIE